MKFFWVLILSVAGAIGPRIAPRIEPVQPSPPSVPPYGLGPQNPYTADPHVNPYVPSPYTNPYVIPR